LRYKFNGLPTEGQTRVLWREVDEGWIRFDPAIGETLLLAPLTRFVLDQVAGHQAELSADDLITAVMKEEPEASPLDCRRLVEASLNALLGAGLILAANLESQ